MTSLSDSSSSVQSSQYVDFFDILQKDDKRDQCSPTALVEKLRYHPALEGYNSLEEIYSLLIMVSRDLFLSHMEMSLWWVILEHFGFDGRYELTRTLYCAAYTTKRAFQTDSYINGDFVENNFVEGFRQYYECWIVDKNVDMTMWVTAASRSSVLPNFLNKDLDYNRVVDSFSTAFFGEPHTFNSK
mmetsp:Transcript_27146/g.31361  ORF Transcript_27146/g.31361 Transcript_27146/m.31361 type:complete len:186 (+) Transcript_27146:51-608(+)